MVGAVAFAKIWKDFGCLAFGCTHSKKITLRLQLFFFFSLLEMNYEFGGQREKDCREAKSEALNFKH